MPELACVTGRFQPVHEQHLELFNVALGRAAHLIIGITNPDSGALFQSDASPHRHRPGDNPFTYFERERFIDAVLATHGLRDRVTIVPFDLGSPSRWPEYVPLEALQIVRVYSEWEAAKARLLEQAGYRVDVLQGDPAHRLSSTEIRARLRANTDWEPMVLPELRPLLRARLKAYRGRQSLQEGGR